MGCDGISNRLSFCLFYRDYSVFSPNINIQEKLLTVNFTLLTLLKMSHNITPFIRCTSGAQQQAEFYCSVFPQATITNHNSIVTTFQIYGGTLATLNGGDHPGATLNPSISFSLRIKDKDETKRIRDLLAEGGSVMMPFQDYFWSPAYGRCNDKYGVSRQVMYDPSTEPGHETDKIIPSLLYVQHNNGKAQEAMELYTSLFPNSAIKYVRPYEAGQGETVGNIAHAEFTLNDQLFIAADSGQNHTFTFTDGVSLAIACDGQDEVDYYWEKLIAD